MPTPTCRRRLSGRVLSRAFADQLIDPDRVPRPQPFPGGVIPANRLDAIFAWRISRLISGSETVHTTIQLANALNYTYDSADVRIYANVVKATHGQTIGEVLGDGDAAQPFQSLALHQKPLTYRVGGDTRGCREHAGRARQRDRVARGGRADRSRPDGPIICDRDRR